ncbi:MAG: hypothetical protein OXI86_04345 [Candidatus Poribacteria bacterium]|nr:hypothetical protein [Candidatus Poribacteria bacterium]
MPVKEHWSETLTEGNTCAILNIHVVPLVLFQEGLNLQFNDLILMSHISILSGIKSSQSEKIVH